MSEISCVQRRCFRCHGGLFLALVLLASGRAEAAGKPHWHDDFIDKKQWLDWRFPEVPHATRYAVTPVAGVSALRISAQQSASALLSRRAFVMDARHPWRLRWRWRIDAAPLVREVTRKSGDDYALRIFVVFEQPERDADWLTRWALRKSPIRTGGYLPERRLVYVWGDQSGPSRPYPSPYSGREMLIPLRYSQQQRGAWFDVEVNPAQDYKTVFGSPAPSRFHLAIMGDTDNSRSEALAWLDWIEVTIDD